MHEILVVISCQFICSSDVNILQNLYFGAFANFKGRREHLELIRLDLLLFWFKRFNSQLLLRLVLLSNGFHLLIAFTECFFSISIQHCIVVDLCCLVTNGSN